MSDHAITELDARVGVMFQEVLRRSHLSAPEDIPRVLAEEVRRIGVDALVVYVVDYEQRTLVPVPAPDVGDSGPLSIQGTVAFLEKKGGFPNLAQRLKDNGVQFFNGSAGTFQAVIRGDIWIGFGADPSAITLKADCVGSSARPIAHSDRPPPEPRMNVAVCSSDGSW